MSASPRTFSDLLAEPGRGLSCSVRMNLPGSRHHTRRVPCCARTSWRAKLLPPPFAPSISKDASSTVGTHRVVPLSSNATRMVHGGGSEGACSPSGQTGPCNGPPAPRWVHFGVQRGPFPTRMERLYSYLPSVCHLCSRCSGGPTRLPGTTKRNTLI